ncbi:8-oxo-dGTP diphosphatase [Streptococcus sp. X16XC17]|uniref:8-oxo-dGTP diphosphatase n=1 Tax=unclassified Streptococcus TaxID=2608887 RepID=UPI00066FC8A3|nr:MULTISPECIES: 8-oxo-dGTP diphosphatase [unclassified Streptococcus]TCD46076.1 8-oxo-dGTP diphosphatase [Streptococcus sp. X16XC17]
MPRSEEVILTNMCLVEDETGRFVMQIRNSERYTLDGAAFSGGHIEKGESLHEAVIREVFEETGLTIFNPQLLGVKHFHTRDDGARYLVFLYKTTEFLGQLQSSEEGEVVWVSHEDIASGKIELADSMSDMFPIFFDKEHSEIFYKRNAEGILERFDF